MLSDNLKVSLQYCLPKHLISRLVGYMASARLGAVTTSLIKLFIKQYQVDMSEAAFREGGWLGVGPGNGDLKHVLPDAHSDFILAVAGEEFGTLFCLILLGMICIIVFRGFMRVGRTRSPFVALAAAGLLTSFALQSLINMASTLALIPAKGITLPFISYGGSSMLAVAITMGFLLALTRRRVGPEPEDEI